MQRRKVHRTHRCLKLYTPNNSRHVRVPATMWLSSRHSLVVDHTETRLSQPRHWLDVILIKTMGLVTNKVVSKVVCITLKKKVFAKLIHFVLLKVKHQHLIVRPIKSNELVSRPRTEARASCRPFENSQQLVQQTVASLKITFSKQPNLRYYVHWQPRMVNRAIDVRHLPLLQNQDHGAWRRIGSLVRFFFLFSLEY